MPERTRRVCIDVGGTFTDCLVMDEAGELTKFKAMPPPRDPSIGLMDAMNKAAHHLGLSIKEFLGQIEVLVHGTTLAANIVLIGRGAKVGMITTKGFRDSFEIRRATKPVDNSLYNLSIPLSQPLIPRARKHKNYILTRRQGRPAMSYRNIDSTTVATVWHSMHTKRQPWRT